MEATINRVKWAARTLIGFGDYHLFWSCIKTDYIGLGFEFPEDAYESEHFCTRDVSLHIFKYYFTFWIEDTK